MVETVLRPVTRQVVRRNITDPCPARQIEEIHCPVLAESVRPPRARRLLMLKPRLPIETCTVDQLPSINTSENWRMLNDRQPCPRAAHQKPQRLPLQQGQIQVMAQGELDSQRIHPMLRLILALDPVTAGSGLFPVVGQNGIDREGSVNWKRKEWIGTERKPRENVGLPCLPPRREASRPRPRPLASATTIHIDPDRDTVGRCPHPVMRNPGLKC